MYDLNDNVRKVILTTDPDLIKDGVKSIDDEFLESYVKKVDKSNLNNIDQYAYWTSKDIEIRDNLNKLKNKLKP